MLANKQLKVGLLLLAAGEASRMGMPKQLLVHQHQPLIRHIIKELLVLELPIIVVLGARAAMIQPVISDFSIEIIINSSWETGMGSSLKAGLLGFEEMHPELESVLCCVVDQPFLTHRLLSKYLIAFTKLPSKNEALIAARYKSNTIGVPALLGSNYIQEIYKEENNIGARKLLNKYAERVLTIDFPMGDFDLDNQQDWTNFREM